MTPELFSDAMNEIGAKYVEEALTYKRPAQRSFWSKLAKRAAMVALVALLALSGFAAASPAARAAMIHWVETWTGSQVSYEYAGAAPHRRAAVLRDHRPAGWLHAGRRYEL